MWSPSRIGLKGAVRRHPAELRLPHKIDVGYIPVWPILHLLNLNLPIPPALMTVFVRTVLKSQSQNGWLHSIVTNKVYQKILQRCEVARYEPNIWLSWVMGVNHASVFQYSDANSHTKAWLLCRVQTTRALNQSSLPRQTISSAT